MLTKNESKNEQNKIIIQFFILFIITLAANYFFSLDSIKKIILKQSSYKDLIAKAQISIKNSTFIIEKVKSSTGIEIEIYEFNKSEQTSRYIQSFKIDKDLNALLQIKSDHEAIIIADLNNDELLDFSIPSIDEFGNARLSSYVFNANLQLFEPYTNSSTN